MGACSLVGWRWDGVWRVACGGRDVWVAATPPTILPPRSIDPLTQVYCNALALYEDVADKGHGSATKAKARGRAPTAPGPSPHVGAEVGMGLSSSVAMLNHRCDPNADWSLDASGGPAGPNVPTPLAGPELGSGASPGRTRRLWTARCSQGARPALWAPSHCLGGSSDPPPQSPIPPPFEHSGCLVVRALRPIRCGEELCLSYVETSLTTAERKAHLLSHFGFECDCARCTTE